MIQKKALITGSHSFVASHLIPFLQDKNIEVINFPREYFDSLHDTSRLIMEQKPDYIFHLAAAGNIVKEKEDTYEIIRANINGLQTLLEAVKDHKLSGFVNCSSSSVLLSRQTVYSATKKAAEDIGRAYRIAYGIPFVSIRPFTLYGEDDNGAHLIPKIFSSCLYQTPLQLAPEPVHDYLYVGDFVQALLSFAQNAMNSSDIWHMGTGVGTTNEQLVHLIENITLRKAKITGSYPIRSYDNVTWKLTDYMDNPIYGATSLREGLQRIFNSYKL